LDEIGVLKNIFTTKITPQTNQDTKKKLAAVLIVIYGKEPTIIMTERPKTMNHHGGEISFPGGMWKVNDHDLLTTALRETREEIDLDIKREQVICQLRPVTTLNSGFTIIPFISVLDKIPKLTPNSEIEAILHIPMIKLFKTFEDDQDPSHKSIQEMYVFRYQNYLIWGASARMLKQIMNILQENRQL